MSVIMPALLGDFGWLVNKFVIYHCRFRLLINLLRLFREIIIRWVWNIRTFCIFSHGIHMRALVNGVKFFTCVYSLNTVQSIRGFLKFNPISITFIVFFKNVSHFVLSRPYAMNGVRATSFYHVGIPIFRRLLHQINSILKIKINKRKPIVCNNILFIICFLIESICCCIFLLLNIIFFKIVFFFVFIFKFINSYV